MVNLHLPNGLAPAEALIRSMRLRGMTEEQINEGLNRAKRQFSFTANRHLNLPGVSEDKRKAIYKTLLAATICQGNI